MCLPLLFFCELVFLSILISLIMDPASLCSCTLDLCEYQHDEQRPRAMRWSRTMENKCVLYDVNAIVWPSQYILLGSSWNNCMVSTVVPVMRIGFGVGCSLGYSDTSMYFSEAYGNSYLVLNYTSTQIGSLPTRCSRVYRPGLFGYFAGRICMYGECQLDIYTLINDFRRQWKTAVCRETFLLNPRLIYHRSNQVECCCLISEATNLRPQR